MCHSVEECLLRCAASLLPLTASVLHSSLIFPLWLSSAPSILQYQAAPCLKIIPFLDCAMGYVPLCLLQPLMLTAFHNLFSFISSLPPSLPGVFSIIIVFGTSLKNVIFKSLLTCRILLLLDAGLSEQKQSLCQPQQRAECKSSTWKYRHALIYCGECNRRKSRKMFPPFMRVVCMSAVYCSSLDRAVGWLSAHWRFLYVRDGQPKLPSSGLDNLTDLTISAKQWKIAWIFKHVLFLGKQNVQLV